MRRPQNLKKSPTYFHSVASSLWPFQKSWSFMFSHYSEQALWPAVWIKNHVWKSKFLTFLRCMVILSRCDKIFHVLVVFGYVTLYSNLFYCTALFCESICSSQHYVGCNWPYDLLNMSLWIESIKSRWPCRAVASGGEGSGVASEPPGS